jgi:hypothetical protein
MPFVRVTLINSSNHVAIARLHLLPGPVLLEVAANEHDTGVVEPPPATVNAIVQTLSVVDVLGPGANTLTFAPSLGGNGGDDIEEAFVYVGRDVLLEESIGGWIVNGGVARWEERALKKKAP